MSKPSTIRAMANHPNRGAKGLKAASNPTPAEIRRKREAAGLTLEQAGALVHTSRRAWENWEADAGAENHRRMHPATWELFQVKLAATRLVEERSLRPSDVRALGLQLPSAA